MQKIELPEPFVQYLIKQPEQGMGYQIVDIALKNGRKYSGLRVLNCSLLLIDEEENILPDDIFEVNVNQ
ncbi:hypothetical protein [Adhaeribacter soli]|uniref:Uncharacterized protein n=1 Tax=Adhaeribacter soli TaxID=2607655 RepID=A0A5N1IWV6_9BACT|nr:hypothetical protein [Adhaeribacter soli]KAA9338810.1 hypothetical protein F0P94_08420 [Adhaeribacter soli]